MSGKELSKILQRIQPGYAYEMLALQIQLEMESQSDQLKIQSITKLIQLYMGAVEALQSKCDKRYKYFSNKIQHLMKRKNVVEHLHIVSTGRTADKKALQQVVKAQIGQRRNQLDLQILLNKQQIDAKKIRQLVKTADNKLKTFERNIQKNLKKQDQDLQQRKRLRRMRSDAGSVTKVDFDRYFQSPNTKHVIKSDKELDDYFGLVGIDKKDKKRSGSIEKKEIQKPKINSGNKLKNYVF